MNKPFEESYDYSEQSWTVVNSLEIRGAEKYLVVQEVAPAEAKSVLEDQSKMSLVDVLCLVYDTSDANSFSYIVNLWQQYDLSGYPVVFIGTKSDKPLAVQQLDMTPEEFAEKLSVAPPLKISMKQRNFEELFGIILGVAINP